MINRILDLLYPVKCPFCGKIMGRNSTGICEACRIELPYIKEPYCMKCGKPIQGEQEEFCFDCKKKKHYFDGGRSLWIHRFPVNRAVYAFKYHDLKCYGRIFAREIAEKLRDYIRWTEAEGIIPIPLHQRRYRERGYNQAEILARELSKYTGIPMMDILARKKYTNPQKVLNDVERRKNIEGAFEIKEKITFKSTILIDDIYTTGSTLDEAAKVLKAEGVQNVYFLTISIGQGF